MLKKLFAAMIVALLFGGTALAFSWWDQLEQNETETVNIGEGVTLNVTAVAEVPDGKVLIPAGSVLKANDVDSIELTYNVVLDQEALTALDLSVTSSNVLIGGSSTYSDLININISQASSTVNATDVLVTVTVTLSDPVTLEAYTAIINQPITFTLTFTGSQQ